MYNLIKRHYSASNKLVCISELLNVGKKVQCPNLDIVKRGILLIIRVHCENMKMYLFLDNSDNPNRVLNWQTRTCSSLQRDSLIELIQIFSLELFLLI